MNVATYRHLIFTTEDILFGAITFIVILLTYSSYSVLRYGLKMSRVVLVALLIKLITTILFVYLTKYVLGGDSLMYYTGASQIASADLGVICEYFFTLNPSELSNHAWSILQGSPVNYFVSIGNNLVGEIGAFFILLFFDSYTSVSFMFALLGFVGTFKFYKVGISLYPSAKRFLALMLLFLPSLLYWSNGIMKDSVCLFFLGIATEAVYTIYILNKLRLQRILALLVSIYFLFYIKVYIAIVFIACLIIVLGKRYYFNIRNKLLRRLALPIFLIVIALGLYFSNALIANQFQRFSSDQILETIKYHQDVTYGASTYSLGNFDGSFVSLFLLLPFALFTSLFRPFLWEVHNIFMLFLSVENLALMFVTIITVIKCGLLRSIKTIFNDDILIYSLTFVIIFGGLVGLSTYNFGNLARYRLPMLPFYALLLAGLLHNNSLTRFGR